MRRSLIVCLLFSGYYFTLSAQSVTINMGTNPAHPSAILEVFAENKGILIPRMTAVQRQGIPVPALGLIVFQTDGNKGLWYYEGVKWNSEALGNRVGEIKYWNGETWVFIPPGENGQNLTICNGIPQWGPCQSQPVVVLTNTTTPVSDTSVLVNITVNGPSNVLVESGVCYGLTQNPTVDSSVVKVTGTPIGTFNVRVQPLLQATTYHFRAYTKLNDGTVVYGSNRSFTTSGSTNIVVLTAPASNIKANGFTLHGEVVQEGRSPVTERGFVWSRFPDPLLTNNLTINGSGKGKFQAVISGLTGTTTYYIRAFAINNEGVAYGNPIEVKTLADSTLEFGNFIKVNGGTFTRGSNFGNNIELPIHSVTLKSFFIGETEVTQSVWQQVMGSNPSFNLDCDQCPVENVSWLDIQEFLKKINEKQSSRIYRLPTEAEWEFAARGGANAANFFYAGSSDIDSVAWYRINSGGKSRPVKLKNPNAIGFYDMSGNVWEWVQDWFHFYKADPLTNPTGPATGSSKLYRGGSFQDIAKDCRTTYRYGNPPASRFNYLGFRLAYD
jgi:hypothetical protein